MLQTTDTRAPEGFNKEETKLRIGELREELAELQDLLYANSKHAVLVVLQGMDASGKDGAIKSVFKGVNPQGLSVTSFKAPTELERKHDFLWRVHPHAPALGHIAVFNRSHYEDVLITRVEGWCDDVKAHKRFQAINDFERLLQEEGNTLLFKFYLHVSREKQAERLEERTTDPAKVWKHNKEDARKREQWEAYREAYEAVFEHCNEVRWTIVPADQNWYKEYVILKTVVEGLRNLRMTYPPLQH